MDRPIKPWRVFLVQLCLFLSGAMVIGWIFHYKGGFSKSISTFPWNLHPVFMTLAFIFCVGQAIVSYSILPFPHRTKKYIHASFHTLALFMVVIGAWATIQFHHDNGIPHFYSAHSWFGLLTIFFFLIQWIFGGFYYLFHIPSLHARTLLLPIHQFSGIVIFCLAATTALGGLIQIQTYYIQTGGKLDYFDSESLFINCIAVSILATVLCVVSILFSSRVEERDEMSTLLVGSSNYREASIRNEAISSM